MHVICMFHRTSSNSDATAQQTWEIPLQLGTARLQSTAIQSSHPRSAGRQVKHAADQHEVQLRSVDEIGGAEDLGRTP